MKHLYVLALAMAAITAIPAAACAEGTNGNEIYAGVGTTGGVLGYGYSLGDHSALRVEGNYLNYSHNFNTSSAKYNGNIKVSLLGAYYDWFFAGPFRLTGGVMAGTREFTGNAVGSSGTVTINHQQYSVAGEYVHASAKYNTVAPYVGVGWGHRPGRGGLGFFGDVGVTYGHPNVKLGASPGLVQAAGSNNIAAEQSILQSKANKLAFYPVIRVGVDYQF